MRNYSLEEVETAFPVVGGGAAPKRNKTAGATLEALRDALPEAFKADLRWNGAAAGVNDMAAGIGPDMNELKSLSAALIRKLERRDLWLTYLIANANMAAQHPHLGRVDKQDFQISGSLIQGSFAGGYNDPGFDERQRMGLS